MGNAGLARTRPAGKAGLADWAESLYPIDGSLPPGGTANTLMNNMPPPPGANQGQAVSMPLPVASTGGLNTGFMNKMVQAASIFKTR
jgi:hypothetical protein